MYTYTYLHTHTFVSANIYIYPSKQAHKIMTDIYIATMSMYSMYRLTISFWLRALSRRSPSNARKTRITMSACAINTKRLNNRGRSHDGWHFQMRLASFSVLAVAVRMQSEWIYSAETACPSPAFPNHLMASFDRRPKVMFQIHPAALPQSQM